MRRTTLIATAALAALALTGCEQPPTGSAPQLNQPDAPSFEPLELDLHEPDSGGPNEYGPLVPATPDGPAEAPEPQMPDEVTAYCHGGAVVDFKPKTPDARQRAQGICADQQTYEEHGFTEPDPRSGDPFGNSGQFQQDMQDWLGQQQR